MVKLFADDLLLAAQDKYFADEFADSAAKRAALIACANSQEILNAIDANVPMQLSVWIGDKLCRVKVKRARKARRNLYTNHADDLSIAWQLAVNDYG